MDNWPVNKVWFLEMEYPAERKILNSRSRSNKYKRSLGAYGLSLVGMKSEINFKWIEKMCTWMGKKTLWTHLLFGYKSHGNVLLSLCPVYLMANIAQVIHIL